MKVSIIDRQPLAAGKEKTAYLLCKQMHFFGFICYL